MMMLRRSWIGAAAILALAAGPALGQQQTEDRQQSQQQGQQGQQREQAQQREQGQQGERLGRLLDQQQGQQGQQGQSGQAGQLEKHLARLLIAKNEAAVKLNELAQQQAEDQQVKQYASQMVEAHQQLNQRLQQIAGSQGGASQQSQPGQRSNQQGTSGQSQSGQSSGQQGGGADQLVQIYEQVETRFTDKLVQGLRDKKGRQFDNTFMGLQVLGHMRMVETFDVMQQQASGQLQQILQQAHKETQQHLERAEQLSQKLEESVASRPQPTQQQ